jgi:hypothetical protein
MKHYKLDIPWLTPQDKAIVDETFFYQFATSQHGYGVYDAEHHGKPAKRVFTPYGSFFAVEQVPNEIKELENAK